MTPEEAIAEAKKQTGLMLVAKEAFDKKPSYSAACQIQVHERRRKEAQRFIKLELV